MWRNPKGRVVILFVLTFAVIIAAANVGSDLADGRLCSTAADYHYVQAAYQTGVNETAAAWHMAKAEAYALADNATCEDWKQYMEVPSVG